MKRLVVLIGLFSLLACEPLMAESRYVIDDLTITMRTGRSNQHNIIKLLKSGDKVEVLDQVEENNREYAHVKVGDKEGWVHAEYLTNEPIARDRLPALEKKLADARAQASDLKQQLSTLQQDHKELSGEADSMRQELARLKQVAARPAEIARQNSRLQEELATLKNNFSSLQEDYAAIRNNKERDWFIAGGGVVIVSIIFGILLTRVRLRPRKNNWRDSI